jgi:hypothetical protein
MDHQLWVVAHLLLLGYWLGTDLAVYHISATIADGRQPTAVRVFAARRMLLLDMVPRSALVLTAAVGLTLTVGLGLLPALHGALVPVWIVALAWLALTWAVFRLEHQPLGRVLARVDFGFRIVVVLAAGALAADAFTADGLVPPAPWLAAKLAIFALIIAMGLAIRLQLRPFGPMFGRVAAGTSDAANDAALARLIARVKVPVWVIWLALVAAAVIGRLKPGLPDLG